MAYWFFMGAFFGVCKIFMHIFTEIFGGFLGGGGGDG